MDFLEAVRRVQEETGGFAAFVPVAVDAPGGRDLDGVTAVERLKTLSISRMFLDNVENVQVSRTGGGLKVLQMGLRFGANDVGSVSAEGGSGRGGRAADYPGCGVPTGGERYGLPDDVFELEGWHQGAFRR